MPSVSFFFVIVFTKPLDTLRQDGFVSSKQDSFISCIMLRAPCQISSHLDLVCSKKNYLQ